MIGVILIKIGFLAYNKFKTRTYGGPILDFSFNRDPKNQRFRHPKDIVSMFDTGAVNEDQQTNDQILWPHSFSGFPDYDKDKKRNIIV